MPDYFAEKAGQVEPETLTAFGITISSRYGKADELIEMLSFCRMAALEHIEHFVKEVFYDSKACVCSFKLDRTVTSGDAIASHVHAIAKKTISQFELFGYIDHGDWLTEDVYE